MTKTVFFALSLGWGLAHGIKESDGKEGRFSGELHQAFDALTDRTPFSAPENVRKSPEHYSFIPYGPRNRLIIRASQSLMTWTLVNGASDPMIAITYTHHMNLHIADFLKSIYGSCFFSTISPPNISGWSPTLGSHAGPTLALSLPLPRNHLWSVFFYCVSTVSQTLIVLCPSMFSCHFCLCLFLIAVISLLQCAFAARVPGYLLCKDTPCFFTFFKYCPQPLVFINCHCCTFFEGKHFLFWRKTFFL